MENLGVTTTIVSDCTECCPRNVSCNLCCCRAEDSSEEKSAEEKTQAVAEQANVVKPRKRDNGCVIL